MNFKCSISDISILMNYVDYKLAPTPAKYVKIAYGLIFLTLCRVFFPQFLTIPNYIFLILCMLLWLLRPSTHAMLMFLLMLLFLFYLGAEGCPDLTRGPEAGFPLSFNCL